MAFAMKVTSQVEAQRKILEEAVSTALDLASGKSDGAEVAVSKTTKDFIVNALGYALEHRDTSLHSALVYSSQSAMKRSGSCVGSHTSTRATSISGTACPPP